MEEASFDQVSFVTVSDPCSTIKGSPFQTHNIHSNNFADITTTTTTIQGHQLSKFNTTTRSERERPTSRWSKIFETSSINEPELGVKGVHNSMFFNQFNTKKSMGAEFNVMDQKSITETNLNKSIDSEIDQTGHKELPHEKLSKQTLNESVEDLEGEIPTPKTWSIINFFSWSARVNDTNSDEPVKRTTTTTSATATATTTTTSTRQSIKDTLFKLKLDKPFLPKLKEMVKVGPKVTRQASLTNLLDLYDYPVTQSALLEDKVFSPKSHRQIFKDLEKIEEVDPGINHKSKRDISTFRYLKSFFKEEVPEVKEVEKEQVIPLSKTVSRQSTIISVPDSDDSSPDEPINSNGPIVQPKRYYKTIEEVITEGDPNILDETIIRKQSLEPEPEEWNQQSPGIPNSSNYGTGRSQPTSLIIEPWSHFTTIRMNAEKSIKKKVPESKENFEDSLNELETLLSNFLQTDDPAIYEGKKLYLLERINDLKIKQSNNSENNALLERSSNNNKPFLKDSTHYNSTNDPSLWKDETQIEDIIEEFLTKSASISSSQKKGAKIDAIFDEDSNEENGEDGGLSAQVDYLTPFITSKPTLDREWSLSSSEFFSPQ
ncbi:hypothetical protein DFJ63DRAFT_310959 [Scheffersomyces coipomensis]|uniref:uncharacterized protein n=1 Tax=Scheffersomyces coipomensis TaxID=1788519 RepID=UPI00315D8E93